MFKNQKSLSKSSEAYRKETVSRLRAYEQTFTSHQKKSKMKQSKTKQSKTKRNGQQGKMAALPPKWGK